MATHVATVAWEHTSGDFPKGTYSREHTWTFDGGLIVPASPSPSVVKVPFSNPAAVDPEEAFVAAIASCHLLTFLYVASRKGFTVLSYRDTAIGEMQENDQGLLWVSKVVLHPRIAYPGGKEPAAVEEESLHALAHEQCFIANSVKTQIVVARA